MIYEEFVELMKKKPHLRTMGKGLLSKRYGITPEEVVQARRDLRDFTKRLPKILIFDVETAPMKAFVWGRWKQNICLDATISEWYMLCWSAKWLYSNEIIGDKLTSEEAKAEDDKRIVSHLWELVNEADIVVAYNGKKADIPWMNTRFIVNGLIPTKPYFIIDPCEVAKKKFGFSSNKLDALAGYFGIEHKLDTDFKLWVKCVEGDEESLNYMLEYNKIDVKILEEVYLKMRPWITNHPNVANYCDEDTRLCTSCGSENYELLEGQYYYTSCNKYQLYRCKDCGTVFRGRSNLNIGKTKFLSVCR